MHDVTMEPPEPPQQPWFGEPFRYPAEHSPTEHYPTEPVAQPTQWLPQPGTGQGSNPTDPWHGPPTHRPSSTQRRNLWIVGAVLGLCAAVTLTFVLARALTHHAPVISTLTPKTDVPVLGPVVLIPGFGGKTSDLDDLKVVLQSAGRDVTVMSLPGDGTGDLTEQARTLSTLVTGVLERTGQSSVDVVGFSAGGVVARLWSREYGGAKIARRIVTMGSPHHGTTVAGFAGLFGTGACPAACQQLRPGSSLLNALNTDGEVPAGPTFVSIWTLNDDVVMPPETAHLDGATNLTLQGLCPYHYANHEQLPTDPVLMRAVALELAAGPPTATPAVTC